MSEPIICEFCGSKSKNKTLLLIHHKGTAKCIKMQIEKLGKPLYEASLKKVEDVKKIVKKEHINKDSEESSDENEEDENQEIPFSSSDEESDLDIQISEDEEPKENIKFKESDEEEPVKSKFSSAKLFKNRNRESTPSPKKEEFKEPPRVPVNNPLPLNQRTAPVNKLQELVNQRMAIANKNPRPEPSKPEPSKPEPIIEPVQEIIQERIKESEPKKSLKHPELMNDLKPQLSPPSINNREIEAKLSLILNTLSSKDNKTVEEIKKLKEEIKTRDEEAKQREEVLAKNKENRIIEENKKLREELKVREEEAKHRNESIVKSISNLEKIINECNPSAMVEIIKKIQAEVESKEELLQIFKEDLDETCDKYYDLYKKLKEVKYDMEEMVYTKKK